MDVGTATRGRGREVAPDTVRDRFAGLVWRPQVERPLSEDLAPTAVRGAAWGSFFAPGPQHTQRCGFRSLTRDVTAEVFSRQSQQWDTGARSY